MRAAVEDTAAALREAGHELVPARPPIPANLGLRFMSRWLAGIAQDADGLPAEALEERTVKMARRGRRVARTVKPAAADPFTARAARWISGFDALIMPTLTRPAVPIGTWAGHGWFRTTLSIGNWLCTLPWNLAGLPAISVPAPASELPAGIQIVAPAGGEAVILAVAAELERLRPWPRLAPLAAERRLWSEPWRTRGSGWWPSGTWCSSGSARWNGSLPGSRRRRARPGPTTSTIRRVPRWPSSVSTPPRCSGRPGSSWRRWTRRWGGWRKAGTAGANGAGSQSGMTGSLPARRRGRASAVRCYSARSAKAVRVFAAQPAGSRAPAAAMTRPDRASRTSSQGWYTLSTEGGTSVCAAWPMTGTT